jgi:hypothetical protein
MNDYGCDFSDRNRSSVAMPQTRKGTEEASLAQSGALTVAGSVKAIRASPFRRIGTTTKASLRSAVEVPVGGLSSSTEVATRLPVGAFHGRTDGFRTIDGDEFLEIACHVADTKGALASRVGIGRSAEISELTVFADNVHAVGIAGSRIALEAIGVGSHFFALAGKVPLALAADSLALFATQAFRIPKTSKIVGYGLPR